MASARLLSLLLGAAVAIDFVAAGAIAAERPNILLVFTDDHATQAISAYGSRINQTPNIDRLAIEGVRFNRCYVPNSICGPCRAVVLTGKYNHKNGFYTNGNTFDGSQQTFPKLLQKAGYQTAVIGKWHLKSEPTGFDYWDVLQGQGSYYNPVLLSQAGKRQVEGYCTEIVTDLALEWLQNTRDADKPFMLMYQQKAPHREWSPPLSKLHQYDGVTIPEPPTLFEDYALRGKPAQHQDMTIAETMTPGDLKLTTPRSLNDEQRKVWEQAYGPKNLAMQRANLSGKDLVRWKYQRYIKDYLRCVSSVDDQLGRMLDYLDASGLAENTLVIYSSDQGFYLGEHGWFDKRWMYEESLRTPCLVRWPAAVEPGRFDDHLVSPLDFAETFLDAAGAEIPADMQGRSLLPLLKGEPPEDWRKTFYYHYYEYPAWHYVRKHYGVTDGRYKLIRFYEPDVDSWELYDLLCDPNEINDVSDNPVYQPVRERLAAELGRLRSELEVPADDPPESKRRSGPPRVRQPTDTPPIPAPGGAA